MSAEVLKYTLEQVEALEVAPGFAHENLEGWIPELASENDLRQALEKAFDYRGDVTLTLKSGERIEAFIFNRLTGATLADSYVQYFTPSAPEKRRVSYAEIARLEFSGKDRAAGKHWEAWVEELQPEESRRRKEHCAGTGSAGLANFWVMHILLQIGKYVLYAAIICLGACGLYRKAKWQAGRRVPKSGIQGLFSNHD